MGKHFTNDQLKTYIDRLLVACPVLEDLKLVHGLLFCVVVGVAVCCGGVAVCVAVLEDLKLVHGLFFCVVRLYLSLQSISGYKDLTLSFPLSSLPQYLNCS